MISDKVFLDLENELVTWEFFCFLLFEALYHSVIR